MSMPKMNRRQFLATTSTLPLASCVTSPLAQAVKPRVKLAIASYSYWHFDPIKYPIKKVIDHAAELGAEGVDVLKVQMPDDSPAYLQGLKRHALLNGGGGAGGAGSGVTAALAALVARDDAAFEAPRRGVLRTCP